MRRRSCYVHLQTVRAKWSESMLPVNESYRITHHWVFLCFRRFSRSDSKSVCLWPSIHRHIIATLLADIMPFEAGLTHMLTPPLSS